MADTSVESAFALAERAAEAGDWATARAGYAHVLELAPAHADAMLQLSFVASFTGRYREANAWALRAAAAPLSAGAEAMVDLIRRLRTFNEVVALRDYARRLRESHAIPARVLVEAASQASILNDFETASSCAEAALQSAPDDPLARLVRAQLLAHYGRVDEASADIEQVLQRHPGIASGWWMLSRLRTQTVGENHVPQLRALLRRPALRPADAAVAARALHKELDDLGDYEGAWQALERMCRARRESLRYDPHASRALFGEIIAWPAAGGSTPVSAAEDGERPTPIFVVGMHRSGTTLLEQLLDASPQVHAAGELNDFPVAMRDATDQHGKGALDRNIVHRAATVDFTAVGQRYLQGIAWRLGDARRFTDKQPANFLNIGYICRALPNAKILHLVRDPVETCFSNLRELFSGINEYSYDQGELAGYFLQYRRLMAHWHATFPGRILDVSYAALTAHPETAMRAVAAHCGIDYVPAMSDPRSSTRVVSTASSVQVRDRVVKRDLPKWAPYAERLRPLIHALRAGGVAITDAPSDT